MTAMLNPAPRRSHARGADFSGRRNNRSICGREKHSEPVGRGDPIQGLWWPGVELGGDGGEIVGGVNGQVCALGEVLPQQAVGVLVGAALPRLCGSQKKTGMSVAVVNWRWRAISVP